MNLKFLYSMSEYTFYKISHPNYPELVYIGSTTDYPARKQNHKYPLL